MKRLCKLAILVSLLSIVFSQTADLNERQDDNNGHQSIFDLLREGIFDRIRGVLSSFINVFIIRENKNRIVTATESPTEVSTSSESQGTQESTQGIGVEPIRQNITLPDCGLSNNRSGVNDKIVGGREARIGEFPWQIVLKITNTQNQTYLCGGSIINEQWILSAAHCVSNENNGKLSVKTLEASAGVHNRKVPGILAQRRWADCVIPHPQWSGRNGSLQNDITLIRIPSNNPYNITYGDGGVVNGVCLPPKSSFEYTGDALVSGWGLVWDRFLLGRPSEVLRVTSVSIIPSKNCASHPIIGHSISEGMICQDTNFKFSSPCQGDSGGPLIYYSESSQSATQIGIVSFGTFMFCANPLLPNTVYTSVAYFLDWIEDTIRTYDGDATCPTRPLRPPVYYAERTAPATNSPLQL